MVGLWSAGRSAARATGLLEAQRKAFVGDGADNNWTLQKRFFGSVPILVFIHALYTRRVGSTECSLAIGSALRYVSRLSRGFEEQQRRARDPAGRPRFEQGGGLAAGTPPTRTVLLVIRQAYVAGPEFDWPNRGKMKDEFTPIGLPIIFKSRSGNQGCASFLQPGKDCIGIIFRRKPYV